MATYYANTDLASYETQVANYHAEHDAWDANVTAAQDTYARMLAAYDQAHADWEANPTDPDSGDPYPEPQPPDPPPDPPAEPQPPAAPATVYSERSVDDAHEWVSTPTGDVLVVPGSVLLTSATSSFAVTPDELAMHYTNTRAPLPT